MVQDLLSAMDTLDLKRPGPGTVQYTTHGHGLRTTVGNATKGNWERIDHFITKAERSVHHGCRDRQVL